jgi:hypothetical protein
METVEISLFQAPSVHSVIVIPGPKAHITPDIKGVSLFLCCRCRLAEITAIYLN